MLDKGLLQAKSEREKPPPWRPRRAVNFERRMKTDHLVFGGERKAARRDIVGDHRAGCITRLVPEPQSDCRPVDRIIVVRYDDVTQEVVLWVVHGVISAGQGRWTKLGPTLPSIFKHS
jgi:hypothetical protein